MGTNTSGLKRDAGPGRPKGRKNEVPKSFKASIKKVFEDIATEDPALIKTAVLRGLKGKPREAFAYLQLAAAYIDGRPADTINVNSAHGATPWVVVVAPDSSSSTSA